MSAIASVVDRIVVYPRLTVSEEDGLLVKPGRFLIRLKNGVGRYVVH